MSFLDWVKKYSIAISFLFGILTGALTMYFGFMSRLNTLEFKLDYSQEEIKREFERMRKNQNDEYDNIYSVFHRQWGHIKKNEVTN